MTRAEKLEYIETKKKGQFEFADVVWTWIGGLMALAPQIMYLIKL